MKVVNRVGAIVLGTLVAMGGLELGLRVASALLRPRPPVIEGDGPDNEIRILCIGESTTAGLWPGLLEDSLRQHHPDLYFRVINRGVIGIRTGDILAQLPQWLDRYRPQIAITMLGINDEGNVLVYPRSGFGARLVEHSKAVKLLVLLWRSAWGIGAPSRPMPTLPDPRPDAQWDPAMRKAMERITIPRGEALEAFRYSTLFEAQPALLEIDPATPVYHVGLLVDALVDAEPQERMTEFFSRVLGLPKSAEMTAAERYEAIRAWGRGHDDAFDTLRMLTSQERLEGDVEGEEHTLLQARRDPAIAGPALVRYAAFLDVVGRTDKARAMLRKARYKLPDDYAWSLALAEISFRFGAFEDARDLLARALELRPDLPNRHRETIVGWLARATAAAGHTREARELLDRLDRMDLELFKEYTRFNYSKIVNLLCERGVTVIAMQYPTLSIEVLRKILDGRDDVIYLENRENFERALRDAPYRAIFTDSFAGSFGHCTPAGEELIAANVLRVVNELVGVRAVKPQSSSP